MRQLWAGTTPIPGARLDFGRDTRNECNQTNLAKSSHCPVFAVYFWRDWLVWVLKWINSSILKLNSFGWPIVNQSSVLKKKCSTNFSSAYKWMNYSIITIYLLGLIKSHDMQKSYASSLWKNIVHQKNMSLITGGSFEPIALIIHTPAFNKFAIIVLPWSKPPLVCSLYLQ